MLTPLHSLLLKTEAEKKNIHHGFFTRCGGVSKGEYASLNVAFKPGEKPENVHENLKRVSDWAQVEPSCLLIPEQIHSGKVYVVDRKFEGESPEADALVTNVPGLALGIVTADCGPVLLADPDAHIIANAHAGWRSILEHILENTIDAMISLGAKRENMIAAVGPCIGQKNYEIDAGFRERFIQDNAASSACFIPAFRKGHFMFDLQGCIMEHIRAQKLKVDSLNQCTYAHEELFYSFRRSAHRKEKKSGRQISLIVIKKAGFSLT